MLDDSHLFFLGQSEFYAASGLMGYIGLALATRAPQGTLLFAFAEDKALSPFCQ